ncbi:MAG: hypothetical protein IKM34_06510 [Clostridia bacterium]|nr:hypothetical protein [Clostridia bacterium]
MKNQGFLSQKKKNTPCWYEGKQYGNFADGECEPMRFALLSAVPLAARVTQTKNKL